MALLQFVALVSLCFAGCSMLALLQFDVYFNFIVLKLICLLKIVLQNNFGCCCLI